MKRLISPIMLIMLLMGSVYPHGGRTDKYGGHNNRKTGTYHFHNAGQLHHKDNPYQNHKACGVCVAQTTASVNTAEVVSESIRISVVQSCLAYLSHNIDQIDGKMNAQTKEAIRQFQKTNDLLASGQITDATLNKILLSAAQAVPK